MYIAIYRLHILLSSVPCSSLSCNVLHFPTLYIQCNIDGDYSSLSSAASAILKLEKVVGTIPNVLSKGVSARKILQKLLRYRCDSDDGDNQSTHVTQSGIRSSGILPVPVLLDEDTEEGEDSNYDYSSAPRGLIDTLVMYVHTYILYKNVLCNTILYYIILCCIVLYCIVLYCIVLYCIVLYCIVVYCIVLYCIVLCCTVLYCIILCCIVLYCIVLYCIVLYCFVLYCVVLYCIVLYYIALYCITLHCIVLYSIVLYSII